MKKLYWFMKIRIRNGEQDLEQVGCYTDKDFDDKDTDKQVEEYLSTFYGEDGIKIGDEYLFNGEIACKVTIFRKITKKQYDVLTEFI